MHNYPAHKPPTSRNVLINRELFVLESNILSKFSKTNFFLPDYQRLNIF